MDRVTFVFRKFGVPLGFLLGFLWGSFVCFLGGSFGALGFPWGPQIHGHQGHLFVGSPYRFPDESLGPRPPPEVIYRDSTKLFMAGDVADAAGSGAGPARNGGFAYIVCVSSDSPYIGLILYSRWPNCVETIRSSARYIHGSYLQDEHNPLSLCIYIYIPYKPKHIWAGVGVSYLLLTWGEARPSARGSGIRKRTPLIYPFSQPPTPLYKPLFMPSKTSPKPTPKAKPTPHGFAGGRPKRCESTLHNPQGAPGAPRRHRGRLGLWVSLRFRLTLACRALQVHANSSELVSEWISSDSAKRYIF